MKKILVFTATYNEAGNIKRLSEGIFSHLPAAELLIIDDNSPDGTGKIIDSIAKNDVRVHAIHRPAKLGLGSAHRLAMKYAVSNGYDILITMDSDFSHNPSYIPKITALLENNDFVTGSRYARGGRSDYNLYRKIISRSANLLARLLLGIPLKECTTSFRGFRTGLLKKMDIDFIRSDGYSFFFESIFYVTRLTNSYSEFPIYFENRASGTSKISKTEIAKSVLNLLRLGLFRLFFNTEKILTGPDSRTLAFSPCSFCGSRFASLLYPKTTGNNGSGDTYNCTSMTHGSHGDIVKCLNCGLVRTDPLPEDADLLKAYSDVEESLYAENIGARLNTFKHNLARIRGLLPEKGSLLDIGAGCGAFVKTALEAGYEAQGIEPSRWCRDYARKSFGINISAGTINELSPPQGGFDIITMFDVAEHLRDPSRDLAKIAQMTKKGGKVVISTLDIGSLAAKIMGKRWPWLMDMHLYYFDKRTFELLLQKAGFNMVACINYTHIIKADYLLLKLQNMSVPFAKPLGRFLRRTPARDLMMAFSLGDIKLYIAERSGPE